ncbi:MAG: phosphate acyltransferase PlsX [Oscillospiraceae bacterium]
MKIIVDAMGGDNAPQAIVEGAIMAAEEFGVDITLVGRGEEILRSVEALGRTDLPAGIEITNASEVVEMEDDPATVTRIKTDSSMTVGLKLLHDGKADAMVSAGSTGALLSGATLIVKRIRGIRRAALAPVVPTADGSGTLVVDVGANAECTSEYLLQFAFMGYYCSKAMTGKPSPRVGLLNIGTEETKGNSLYKETYTLLRRAGDEGRINFVGNVEARDVMDGVCDVLVCDGFTGNILLKGLEGMGRFFISEIKKIFSKNAKTKLAAAALRDDFTELKKRTDSSEVGGTAMLGITKPVIKAHGSSDAYAIRSAVRQAMNTVSSGVCGDIEANIQYMKVSAPEA